MIDYEGLRDLCPVCHVSGMQSCVDEQDNDCPDHLGRPVEQATE